MENAEENFIKGQMVCLRFFVSVVSDADAIVPNGVDDVLDIHKKALP